MIGGATLVIVRLKVRSANPLVELFLARMVKVYVTFWSPPDSLTGMPCNLPVVTTWMPKGKRPDTRLYTNVPALGS